MIYHNRSSRNVQHFKIIFQHVVFLFVENSTSFGLGFTRLDRHRYSDITERLKSTNIVEEVQDTRKNVKIVRRERKQATSHNWHFVTDRRDDDNSDDRNDDGKRSRRWENNIKMDLRERDWDIVDWIHVPGDRQQWRILTNTVINYKRRGVS
jgi:hypothetical protein